MKMLTPKAAAEVAGVSESLVYEWCRRKLLVHYRFGVNGRGGKILIDPADLAAFQAACKIEPLPDEGDEEELEFLK
jgi:hypothetical protein